MIYRQTTMLKESRLIFQGIDIPQPSENEGEIPIPDNFNPEEYGRIRREKREKLRALEEASDDPTGFAKLHETSNVLEQFTTEEKLAILQSILEEASKVPEEVQWRLEQIEILRLVVENSINEIRAPKTTVQKWANMGMNLRTMLHLPTPAKDMLEQKANEMEQMLERDIPEITREVLKNEKSLQEVLNDFPRLQKVSQQAYKWDDREHYKDELGFGMNLTEATSEEDILSQYNLLMRFYRSQQNYEAAEALAHQIIGDELENTISENERNALRENASKKIETIVSKNRASWLHPKDDTEPMTEQDIQRWQTAVTEQEYRHQAMAQGARNAKETHQIPGYHGQDRSRAKMHIYDQYVDMRDPHGHWFNVKDENWDTIVEELAINAPLIIASGGVSGILSTGARTVALRMAPSLLVKEGAKLTALNIAKRAAIGIPTLLVEGAAFEAIHSGLQGEWLFSMPDWGQRIFWSSMTLGMIHGGGKIGERFFTKGVGDTAKATLLGEYVNKISNPSVRECAKQCLVKGHTEAASMLIAGAIQNAAYTGDVDAFFDSLGGDEVFHAYVTVGSLKVSRAGIETASGKVFRPTKVRGVEVEEGKNIKREKVVKKISDVENAEKTKKVKKLESRNKESKIALVKENLSEKQPYEMTREEFGEYVVFHGTSSNRAEAIQNSIKHPKIQENPKYQGKNYVGRVISNGTLGMGADFTYNAITAAKYAESKSQIINRMKSNEVQDTGVVIFTRRSDINLPPKGTYQDASEALLSEGNPNTKAKTGGVLGSMPASLFDGLDQINPKHVEVAYDRAYQYVLDQHRLKISQDVHVPKSETVDKSSPQYWRDREKSIRSTEQKLETIDDGFGVFVAERTLYHGSRTPGIMRFNLPEDSSTAGEGVYLTTADAAIGYAHGSRKGSAPTIYETRIRAVKLVDLRQKQNLQNVVDDMRAALKSELELAKQNSSKYEEGFIGDTLVNIIDSKNMHSKLNIMAQRFPQLFTKLIQDYGYDGVVIIEGGEPAHWKDHESWVIFDPDRVEILREHQVAKMSH